MVHPAGVLNLTTNTRLHVLIPPMPTGGDQSLHSLAHELVRPSWPLDVGRYTRHYTGVGADKEAMFIRSHGARALEMLLHLPEWNDTMCTPNVRTVRLPTIAPRRPVHEHANQYATEIEYTHHCRLSAQSGKVGHALGFAPHQLASLWTASGGASGRRATTI